MKIIHIIMLTTFFISPTTHASEYQYLQLIDKLDRPVDGYCLDVVGSGPNIRVDMPLTAHNCKGPQVYFDEVVTLRKDRTLYFSKYNGCVTVMGNNQTALPKNALMLKACRAKQPFLNAANFQQFEFNDNRQLRLKNSNLCISAGNFSHTTFSPAHRWRSLYMEQCDQTENRLSRWQFIPAGVKQP